jgi:UDP-N-acetylmuramate dehydrogenase
MITILENEPLSKHTNMRVGGPADYFVEVKTQEELIEAIEKAKSLKVPHFILGGGTNIVIGDRGYRGMVIKNKMDQIKVVGFKAGLQKAANVGIRDVYVKADTGVLLNRLVRYALEQELSGIENFLGQPGTIGGAMYINAHNMKENDFFGDHVAQATLPQRGT